MTVSQNLFESFYPTDWLDSVQSSQHSFIVPLDDHADSKAESVRTLFALSAGAMYVYRPSKRRRVLNRAVAKLEKSALPGYEHVIEHLHDKYRRNLTISTISQTDLTLHVFLSFLNIERKTDIENISRKDIAAYVEHEQERGLKHIHGIVMKENRNMLALAKKQGFVVKIQKDLGEYEISEKFRPIGIG
ncbi:MAG: hypothetical protein ACI8ZB_005418 [Desulforhopalus sp.]|jgi:hypothetical protein